MQVNLRVLAGPYQGRIFTFDQPDTFLIGRTDDSHLCLPEDKFFSRHHCLLEVNPPRCLMRDLGSTNGTFVNGQRVSEAFLKSGDRIQGGETVLLVEVNTTETTGPISTNSFPSREENFSRPTIVNVECLNCGRRDKAEADSTDEHLTFLCEDCRIELKHSPQPIPGYDTIRILGRGGMGSVMLARDQKTGRAVAIKTLLPEFAVSDKAMRRFMREIDVAAALRHSNIVEFLDRGVNNGVVYLVTEFIDGPDAAKLADARGGRLPVPEGLTIISQALAALQHAHAQGYIHRDIKDQNILVSGSWPHITAKLTDFGLAKSFTQSGMSGVTVAGEMAGTLAYMPPEQLKNFRDVQPQSDVYALGMTAYSLLAGTLALKLGRKTSMAETIKAIFEQAPIPLRERAPQIPQQVCEIIDRALVKDPAERWQSAAAMRNALMHAM
ncbi:MAG TPA: protein kinase [Pyrinomonadaceae bacterium]|nr:protein kinase [Pyrinomonadaceae bacterium]